MQVPRVVTLALAAGLGVGVAALGVSCSFPEIQYNAASGSTGAGGAPTGTGGAPTGTGGAPTGTGGATGTGGSGGIGGTSSTGTGGSIDCTDQDDDGETSVACDGGTDCDDDGDTHDSVLCDGGADCNDTDTEVRPGQANYYPVPNSNGNFDYNCDGMETPQFAYFNCSGLVCNPTNSIFTQNVPCGMQGTFGNCNGLCQTVNPSVQTRLCR
jgi:hypothetical protein